MAEWLSRGRTHLDAHQVAQRVRLHAEPRPLDQADAQLRRAARPYALSFARAVVELRVRRARLPQSLRGTAGAGWARVSGKGRVRVGCGSGAGRVRVGCQQQRLSLHGGGAARLQQRLEDAPLANRTLRREGRQPIVEREGVGDACARAVKARRVVELDAQQARHLREGGISRCGTGSDTAQRCGAEYRRGNACGVTGRCAWPPCAGAGTLSEAECGRPRSVRRGRTSPSRRLSSSSDAG
eukprot:5718271-Prymnesium_polylepis.1